MFGPKKAKLSKADLKKTVVKANERLKSANNRMQSDIKAGKDELKLIETHHKEALKSLKDTKDLQVYAVNELEATQFELAEIETITKIYPAGTCFDKKAKPKKIGKINQ